MGFVDELEERCPSVIETLSGCIVAAFGGDCIQLLEGDAGFEVARGLGQGFQFFVRGLHVFLAVALAEFAFGIGIVGGEVAGPMEVEVGAQNPAGEGAHPLIPTSVPSGSSHVGNTTLPSGSSCIGRG